jgi:steroid 5-alpha reductase family enzyme
MSWQVFIAGALLISAALSAVMAGAWLVQQRTGNSGWVDTIWTFGLGAIGVAAALAPASNSSFPWRQGVVAVVLAVWSLRLGLHIARRTAGITDDPRYAELIRGWGVRARSEMFWLLQKQALVSIPLALSVFIAAHNPEQGLRAQDIAALLLLAIAVIGEAAADRQLGTFRSNAANRTRVCDVGLWRYSRHPNYFFEWLSWVSYPLLAIDLSGTYPLGWLALSAPLCMYWLLVYVSGVPPLEEHMVRSRGSAYRAYQARTSAFFPFPPSTVEKQP